MPADRKGKAIQIDHYLYDELWDSGPKQIPEKIKMIAKNSVEKEEIKQEETKKKSNVPKTDKIQQVVFEEEKKDSSIVSGKK